MKKLFEILVCFLHPVAVILMWIDLATDRPDLRKGGKLAWAIFGLIPLVPFLYVITGVTSGNPAATRTPAATTWSATAG